MPEGSSFVEARDLHVDRVLTDLSVRYRNEAFLAEELMPTVKVNKRSDKYFKYDKENSFRIVDSSVGPKAKPNEVDWEVGVENYSVEDHALADYVPIENVDNADTPLAPRADTNEFLNELLSLGREKRVADLVFAEGTYPASNLYKPANGKKWGTEGDAPIGDVLKAVEGCFMRANVLVFGQEAWQKFRTLPEVLDAVKSSTRTDDTPGGLATASEVASLFEVEKVLVGRARYISSKPGQAAVYARLWRKSCAALHVKKSPGVKSITFGVTFSEMERETQTAYDAKRGAKGAEYMKVAYNADERIIAKDLGYLIKNAVA